MNKFNENSIQVIYEDTVHAPVSIVFPLCCPVEEYKWIEGWKCELINCPNDRVEQGTIFNEILSAPFLLGASSGKTTWTAIFHDPENFKLHFKLDNAISSSLYKIELADNDKDGTDILLNLTYRTLNAKGNKIINNRGKEKIYFMLAIISKMLKYYCETGNMLKSGAISKLVMQSDQLTLMDRIRLAFNKFAMQRMKDNDRERILAHFSE